MVARCDLILLQRPWEPFELPKTELEGAQNNVNEAGAQKHSTTQ